VNIDRSAITNWVETHQAELTPIQLRVLALRFGALGEKVHSLEQVQRELMITQEDIRIIESEVLRQIKKKASE